MKTNKLLSLAFVLGLLVLTACNNNADKTADNTTGDTTNNTRSIKGEEVSYSGDSVTLNGFVAYDQNSTAKRPVVLIVHEWWGAEDYVRNRAKQLADMGYLAMAIDMFGNGRMGKNPQEAMALTGSIYGNTALIKSRFDAALNKIKTYPQADTANIAAIGYCFGGTMVLNAAKLGEPLVGVVSFHGGLATAAPTKKELLKSKILVCHGNADNFVPPAEVAQFKKSMDSIGADYTFIGYDSATHAFTNPNATDKGKEFGLPIKYNAEADRASWADMKSFFDRIFTRQK